jgi:hypothetical protein
VKTLNQSFHKPSPKDILRTFSFEQGFHFYYGNGGYSGLTATSLSEFALKLESVDISSILFHYPRGDFQRWIDSTLGDKELADQMCLVKTGVPHESVRTQLVNLVQTRISELERALSQV